MIESVLLAGMSGLYGYLTIRLMRASYEEFKTYSRSTDTDQA
jgi:hypothetical protein